MTNFHTRYILLSTVCVGTLIAGCGSDDEGLSDTQFRDQANEIFCEGSAEIGEAVGAAFAGEPTPETLQEALGTIVSVSYRQFDDVDALLPPSDMRDDVDAMIAEGRAATKVAEEQGLGFFEIDDNPWARTVQLGAELGLDECATSG